MGGYFDLDQLDMCLGGTLPDDGMWDFDACAKRMRQMDSELAERLEAAKSLQLSVPLE